MPFYCALPYAMSIFTACAALYRTYEGQRGRLLPIDGHEPDDRAALGDPDDAAWEPVSV